MSEDVAPGSGLKKLALFAAFLVACGGVDPGRPAGRRLVPMSGASARWPRPLAFALLSNRLFRREKIRPPMRRYLLRFGVSMTAYVILLVTAVSLGRQGLADGPGAI